MWSVYALTYDSNDDCCEILASYIKYFSRYFQGPLKYNIHKVFQLFSSFYLYNTKSKDHFICFIKNGSIKPNVESKEGVCLTNTN